MCIPFDCNCDVVDHPNGGAFEIKPEYNVERNRLESFKDWENSAIEPAQLALFGFYYTGVSDLVKCNFCGIEVGEWTAGDQAYGEHLRIFPNCTLLNRVAVENEPLDADLLDAGLVEPLDYSDVKIRLASFANNWPCGKIPTPEQLSEAGLYYYKCSDQVRCYTCGGGLKDWMEEDIPWEEHALNYPSCFFVKLTKGDQYIKDIQNKYRARFDEPPSSPSVLPAVIDDFNSNHSSPQLRKTQVDLGGVAIPSTLSSPSSSSPTPPSLCKQCFDAPIDTVFIPCMHVVVCQKCASKLTKCLLCSENISTAKRIYFS